MWKVQIAYEENIKISHLKDKSKRPKFQKMLGHFNLSQEKGKTTNGGS